ncbi:MAG: hypothetical protein U1F20_05100 [Lysobacterales bacterium]
MPMANGLDHVAMAAAVARVLHRLDPRRAKGAGGSSSSSRASLSSKPVSGAPSRSPG